MLDTYVATLDNPVNPSATPPSALVSQVAMAYVNISYLEQTIPLIEKQMALLTINASGVKLDYKPSFEYAFERLQAKVLEIIDKYVTKVLGKARQEISTMPEKIPKEAREYIRELSTFAGDLEKDVLRMPREMYLKIVRHFFELVSYEYWQFLLANNVSTFNRTAARGLLVDVTYLIDASAIIPVKGASDVLLEFQQVLTLITSEHINSFIQNDEFRLKHYDKITNWKLLITVLNKYSESANIVTRIFQDDQKKAIENLKAFLRSKQ